MSSWSSKVAPSAAALHRLVVENPCGMVVVDGRGIVVFANPAALRLLRSAGRALVGTEFGWSTATTRPTEIHIPETGVVAQMRVVRLEWEGRPARLVALHDVGDRQEATRPEPPASALPVAEHLVGLGSFDIDVPTGNVTRSPGYARILGRSMTELASHPRLLTEAVHPDDLERFLQSHDAAMTGERPLDIEFRFVRPDGEVRMVHAVGELMLGEDGRPAKLRGVIRDITEEHRAVEALRASEERFRLLAEYSEDVIFLVRLVPEPVVEYISPAAETVLGRSQEELSGDLPEILSVLRSDGRGIAEGALRSSQASPYVYSGRRRDGSMAWFEQRLVAIRDANGQVVAVEGNLRDVTGRVLAEREQRRLAHQRGQAERLEALGRLAGGVAHDFNNLLAVIMGTAELLAEDMEPGDARLADVDRISHAAERGAALTRQLLIFSRREPTRPEILDLNQVVAKLENMLRRTIGEDIEFVSLLSPGLAAVSIDRTKLEQVVLNLVVNARSAMPGGGRLTVETSNIVIPDPNLPAPAAEPVVQAGEYVRLTVTDTGCGMSPEVVRRAFEPFFTTRDHGEGSGLGLATVHGVVKEAGGHITLDSRPGAGTTFQVYLPALSARVDSDPVERAAAPRGRGETVLVVEDERAVREVIARVLSRNGYQVLTTRSAAEALEICADPEVSIEVMITDLIMPGMPGGRLAELLAVSRPELAVVFMSGYVAGQKLPDPVLREDAPILAKPFEADTLLRRVRMACDARTRPPADQPAD